MLRKHFAVVVSGLVFACLAAALISTRTAAAGEQAGETRLQERWVYLSTNLYVDKNADDAVEIMRRAAGCGYNGVLFADFKTFTWWKLESADRWKANAGKLRKAADELDLKLNVCVFPFGYAGSLLFHDPNLASGTPVRNAPFTARNGKLEAVREVELKNGSFEEHKGDKALGYGFQDEPGTGSFMDTETVKDGTVSLRFQDVGKVNKHGHGRIYQKVRIKPWRQYRIRAWMKAENLTADEVRIMAMAGGRTLQRQYLSVPGKLERVRVTDSFRNVSFDWFEESVTFNSLDNTEAGVYLGMWGGKTGKLWIDDVRIDEVPLLNLVRRDSLPLWVIGENGIAYEEGVDFEPVRDEKMGHKSWSGTFDTRHEPPVIKLTEKTRIKEGERVFVSCCHATIVNNEQVNCSMDAPKVFQLCRMEVFKAREALSPDGWLMSHDEIRSAGWEPEQVARFKTSGELFAYNIKRCYGILAADGAGKPIYLWSDMYDPFHNAHDKYYLVNNTLEGSWEGLDPNIVIMKWGTNRKGLEFFAEKGFKQMIAGYYDGNVEANHRQWLDAAEGVPNIIGVMYTTWGHNFDDLESFADTWWDGRAGAEKIDAAGNR